MRTVPRQRRPAQSCVRVVVPLESATEIVIYAALLRDRLTLGALSPVTFLRPGEETTVDIGAGRAIMLVERRSGSRAATGTSPPAPSENADEQLPPTIGSGGAPLRREVA